MDSRRKELGEFLQVMRGRHAPEEFGFPAGSRRRAQGLRREEVAQLAGISPTWYTWIEQGRAVNVSAEALNRLAQTLRQRCHTGIAPGFRWFGIRQVRYPLSRRPRLAQHF